MKSRFFNFIMAAAAMLTASACNGDKPEPTPEPEPEKTIEWATPGSNQMLRGKAVTDIKSSAYDLKVKGGGSVFYFSPEEGLETIDAIVAAGKYLKIETDGFTGNINLKDGIYTITYGSFKFTSANFKNLDEGSLKINVTGRSSVSLDMDLRMKSSEQVAAKYDGKSVKQMHSIQNQYEVDGKEDRTASIGSIVEKIHDAEGITYFYLYEDPGITEYSSELEPSVTIRTKSDASLENVDFSQVSAEDILVTSGEFSSENGATGKLSITRQPKLGTLLVSANLTTAEDVNFRAEYNKGYSSTFKSENVIRRYDAQGKMVSEKALDKVFRKSPFAASIELYMGDSEDKENVNNLTLGTYAVEISVSPDKEGKMLDASDTEAGYNLNVFDYQTYETVRSEKGAEGNIIVRYVDGSNISIYFRYSVKLKTTGETIEAEYFGPVTSFTEDTELTPVPPFTSHFGIYKPNGDKVLERNVTEVQIRRETDIRHTLTGLAYPEVYYFYFVNQYTQYNGIDATNATPCLMINPEYINKGEVDLTTAPKAYALWYSTREFVLLSTSGVIGTADGYGPSVATMEIVQGEDGYYEIDVYIYDWGKTSILADTETGSKYDLRIQWKGKVSQYTVSKKNEW